MKSITVQELNQKMDTKEDFTLLDVREDRELIMASIAGATHIPMMAIPYQMNEINKDKPVYILMKNEIKEQYGEELWNRIDLKLKGEHE